MEAIERVDAELVGGVWVGTCRDSADRLAVVTDEAPTRLRALEAARRWAGATDAPGAEPKRYVWLASQRYPGRHDVFWESRLGRRPVPREPV